MSNQENLLMNLTLTIVHGKGLVSSSYFLSQLMIRLGIVTSISRIIAELESQHLIKHEDYFDGTSGLIKNISITDIGRQFLHENPIQKQREEYISAFGDSDLLTLLIS